MKEEFKDNKHQESAIEAAATIDAVLRVQTNWKELWFYQKTVVLYQMTYVFCQRFLPKFGDRTVDQMVQAARSGKQNIAEGLADGVTSMEMELKLLNVARSSIKELLEDYEDYIVSRRLSYWKVGHERYDGLLRFCRSHNQLGDYEPYFYKWSDEEMANTAVSLCHFVDKMMTTYQQKLAEDFCQNGGIRERMTAARLKTRAIQKSTIDALQHEIEHLKAELQRLKAENEALRRRLEAR